MARHSRPGKRGATPPRDALTQAKAPAGFLEAWNRLVATWDLPALPRRRGRTPRVPVRDLLPALTFHVLSGAGTLSEHFSQLFDAPLADSSWADRRARLPWAIFAELMQHVLRPQATRRQPDAFWRGWRVVALDGTQFSLTNTPQIVDTLPKARTRRGRAAFAKLTSCVLLEVGLHNPLAAAIGRRGQSEWELALSLLARMPKRALVLADRLYGCAAFVEQAQTTCARVGSHFVVRARRNHIARRLTRLSDGSRLVRVPVRAPGAGGHIRHWIDVREIQVRVGRTGHRTHTLRLWTSLLEARTAPALELAQLYARRWEHELYFRELKRQLRKTAVLQSHTVETAAQEIAALILASALIATERARAAPHDVPVLRVSFPKVLDWVRAAWLAVTQFDDIVTPQQMQTFVSRAYQQMGRCITAERRPRSYPRAVRQTVSRWPRLLRNQSTTGPLHFKVL
ncbi:MAG TPA: IS4 family transposase [Vicinamibacterales bacterium]|nr:IS4 family transposase [Vicinamibacterales bacterium]